MTALAFKSIPADLFRKISPQRGTSRRGSLARRAQRAAMDAFAKTGIPNRRVEAWKYTDLANALVRLGRQAPRHAADECFAASVRNRSGRRLSQPSAQMARIVDLATLDSQRARLGEGKSGPHGRQAPEQPLGAASLALMRGGVAMRVPRHTQRCISHLLHSGAGATAVSHARVLIVVEEGASLRLMEMPSGEGMRRRLPIIGVELVLKPEREARACALQAEAPTALHVTSIAVPLARDAEYRALYAALGARLSRLDIEHCT